jgi:hypothetical protein
VLAQPQLLRSARCIELSQLADERGAEHSELPVKVFLRPIEARVSGECETVCRVVGAVRLERDYLRSCIVCSGVVAKEKLGRVAVVNSAARSH